MGLRLRLGSGLGVRVEVGLTFLVGWVVGDLQNKAFISTQVVVEVEV